jgi:hypothetical protein
MVTIMSRPLHPRERILVPSEYEAGKNPEQVSTYSRQLYLASAEIQTPDFPADSPVAMPIALRRLSTTQYEHQRWFSFEYSENITEVKETTRIGHELNGSSFASTSCI